MGLGGGGEVLGGGGGGVGLGWGGMDEPMYCIWWAKSLRPIRRMLRRVRRMVDIVLFASDRCRRTRLTCAVQR